MRGSKQSFMLEYVGASVRGPANTFRDKPKQDAWKIFRRSWGTLGVVCDGLGSKQHSRVGALAACLAVRDAVSQAHSKGVPPDMGVYMEKIWSLWTSRIRPLDPDECMTTCLFVLRSPQGWFGAQLGDGFLGFSTNTDEIISCGSDPQNAFNLTNALSSDNPKSAWRFIGPLPVTSVKGAILATDGVSDDIDPQSYSLLLQDLIKEYQPLSQRARFHQLRSELMNWSTPHHLDDKTLLALWKESIS